MVSTRFVPSRPAVLFLLSLLPALFFSPRGPAQEGKLPPAGRLPGLLRALESLSRRVGDPGDVRAQAARLGWDLERIQAFVRDQVGYQAYPGSLRGVRGTLRTRRGNSLDRALLLSALLRASGFPAEVLHVRLSPGAALALAEASLRESARPPRVSGMPKTFLPEAADLLGVSPGPLESWVFWKRRRSRAAREALLGAGVREGEELARILSSGKIRPPRGGKVLLERLAGFAADHFLVRVRTGKGRKDLDPGPFPGAGRKGKPGPWGARSFSWTVGFRLSLLRSSGSGKEEAVLLDRSFPLARVAGGGCYLSWLPQPGSFPPGKKLGALDPAGRARLWKKVKILRAELLVRGESFPALPFDLQGRVYKADPYGAVAPAGKFGGALAGRMGGLFGGGGKKEHKGFKFLGLRLSVVVSGPGEGKVTYERMLLPPRPEKKDAPRALPLGRLALLFQGAPATGRDSLFRILAGLTRNAAVLGRIARGERKGLRLLPPREAPAILLRFALERSRLVERIRSGREGLPFLWDRPQVYGLQGNLWWDPEKGTFFFRERIDILENRLAPLPPPGAGLPRGALVLGVADTALEASLLPPLGRGARTLSAWNLLSRERLSGREPSLAKVAGNRILVRWGPSACWDVDGKTWVPAGRVPSGAGQGMLEYAIKARDVMSTVCQVSALVDIFIAGDPALGRKFGGADRVKGYICAALDGNLPAAYLNNLISDMTAGLWKGAADALAGVE